MEEVSLTETESRYYGDLFLFCDEEKTGKIPMLKASELFRSANLSNEKILEITSLAGIPDTALHVSRAQFYSCLKLIAAHQASMQLRQELIAASVQLPLPRFSWTDSSNRRNSLQRRTEWHDTNPMRSRRNSSSHQHKTDTITLNSDLPSTDSEVDQCESSCGGEDGVIGTKIKHRGGGSPEAWSTNSDSPTPTNSVAERPWAKETLWHGLLGDEHRQLLGTEEESSDRHSSDDENETDLETVYQITPEQREYYFNQFKNVHHDTNGLLSGQVARVFFEKSRIPVEELRHIWQLCDVTRDGALSLAEFTAAMHLVVLRRNNIPLPATLPVCLHPTVLQHTTLGNQLSAQEPAEADLLHLDEDDEDSTDNTIIGIKAGMVVGGSTESGALLLNENTVMNLSTLSASSQASGSSRQCVNVCTKNPHSLTPPSIPPPVKNRSISNSPKADMPASTSPLNAPSGKLGYSANTDCSLWATTASNDEHLQFVTTDTQPSQWTKFNESPTSNVSSPGPKPVNFDMQRTAQAVVSDPQILHPVPLRVTPVGGVITSNVPTVPVNDKYGHDSGDNGASIREPSPKSSFIASNNAPHHRDSLQHIDLRAIQRPQAKKLPTKNIGAIPPPPQREPATMSASVVATTSNIPDIGNANIAALSGSSVLSPSTHINKKDPPPLPPPRPHRHGRSSSLDLNKFKIGTINGAQPEIMAQASFDLQTTGFADFTTGFSDDSHTPSVITEIQQMHSLPPQTLQGRAIPQVPSAQAMPPTRLSLQSNQRVSAFEIYRKPNTPRNSQSPKPLTTSNVVGLQPPLPPPFGSVGVAAPTVLPNSEIYEKRVNAISDTLRHVSFKQENNQNNMTDVLRHLREQNNLLLRLCNDLSDELLTVQTRKEEMRLQLEASSAASTDMALPSVALTATASTSALGHVAVIRTGSSISAPVTANVTGGSGSSGVHSNV
ncbi:uncharacterized protein LOC106095584 isoform X2 [Stomoxys calcitrans]|uniref:RalBP1-associated Eps domain-containing protein 1 n=1 Tax=Stomoxys calcitrans TaxID=35570 RepID=A0A1I8PDK3_STOCA|nr:uncharacterized protein LOC106095584 isoform X2 [Stomoxys calcitrans]